MWNSVKQNKNEQEDDEYVLIRDSSGARIVCFLLPWAALSEVLEGRDSPARAG